MEVNFDILRKQIAQEYNTLVKELNKSILEERCYHKSTKVGGDVKHGDILLQSSSVSHAINRLHDLIGTLAACHNGTDVQDISDDITLLTLKQ